MHTILHICRTSKILETSKAFEELMAVRLRNRRKQIFSQSCLNDSVLIESLISKVDYPKHSCWYSSQFKNIFLLYYELAPKVLRQSESFLELKRTTPLLKYKINIYFLSSRATAAYNNYSRC